MLGMLEEAEAVASPESPAAAVPLLLLPVLLLLLLPASPPKLVMPTPSAACLEF